MKSTLLASFLSLCACLSHAQRNFDNVEIETIPVADGIYMLKGSGGNIGVSVGEDGILIIDDQFAPLAGKIEAALGKLSPGQPRFVLNTHHHGDHTGGNAIFAEQGATVIAHDNVRKRLADDGKSKQTLPVITFANSASVHFNGQEIRLYHAGAGHTDGDSIVYFTKSNVIHMGDLFFNGRFPFVDLRSGGSVAGYVRTVATVLEKAPPDAKIIPGHGELADVDDLGKFHAMLVETTRLVRDAKSAGKSLEQVKAAGLPEKYADWGSGFISTDRWIETIYRDSE